ncbi:MAG TPA: EAL domain-containing protein [Nitrosomonas mobilis]|nr:EAL domain-containing protein [Nitrosomonas mobilis]
MSIRVNCLFGGFAQVVSQALQQTGLPASSLTLEITEDAIVNNIPLAREVLGKIKKLGVVIALDDFGTGYSSLSLLRDLPIDTLKIDKSFIRALGQNSHDFMITQAIIGLGENLNLEIIAEGVETKRQMQILLDHHCDLQQGYYFSRPVPYTTLLKWMHSPTYGRL